MEKEPWQDVLLPPGNKDHLWKLFHENSKIGRYQQSLSDKEVLRRIKELYESLSYEGYPLVELPPYKTPTKVFVEDAISARISTRDFTPCQLELETVGSLLHYAYGVTRDNSDTTFPRPFRVVPSGGALYPLEIFFHSAHIRGIKSGLYHYNASKHHLRRLRQGDDTLKISQAIVHQGLVQSAALIFFLTAIFERSTFKYEDRGYRFVHLEAGHVAQNINLVSTALGLGCINIGGFFDREIDDYLWLDGINHSTIYMIAIGKKGTSDSYEAVRD